MNLLQSLVARTAPVFIAQGMHGEGIREKLMLEPGIVLVDSPRHASVLLVAGGVPPEHQQALRRLHEQLPRPAATVWFATEPLIELQHAIKVERLDALPGALIDAHHGLLNGSTPASPELLADEPPSPWQGLGDHGQGGKGMMGGVPYGRPMAMAMMDDIRDGLMLDSLSFTLGPFFPLLPAGLVLELTLQGDVIQMAMIKAKPYPVSVSPLFFKALDGPVPIAELEIARARHHLRRLAQLLRLAGLHALALRTLAEAQALQAGDQLPQLRKRLVRSGLLQAMPAKLGMLDREQARSLGGPAARAAGLKHDAREQDPHYRQLGFELKAQQQHGNYQARLLQWLDETEQALVLAADAQRQNLYTSTEQIETPLGMLSHESQPMDMSSLLADLLPGLEWGEAMAVIASLDLPALSPYTDTQVLHRGADKGAA
jgi:hypothetical protein